MKALVFGEVLWDVYPDKKVIGGAPFNFAAHLALLDNEVSLVTAVGADTLGEDTRAMIQKYGVCDRFVQTSDKQTGSCLVTLGENGVPRYHLLTDVAYDNVILTEDDLAALREEKAELFYFNTLAQRHPVSRAAIRQILDTISFRDILCDLNIRPNSYDADSIRLCLSRATIVKISAEEAHFLTDLGVLPPDAPFADALRAAFPNLHLLVYTMGGEGSAVYNFRDGTIHRSGEPGDVIVVSTVGAGDCYGATFADAFLKTGDIDAAIAKAAARSDIVVANTEAIPDCLLA